MEVFKKYKLHLKQLDYPYINAFNEEQIPDIFIPSNRNFLLTWLMGKLNPKTMDRDVPKALSEAAIEDYYCAQGLCKSSQKLFLEANNNINDQVLFFDRTFEYLIQLKNSKDRNDWDTTADVNFLTKDINLFPYFGPVTKSTAEKRENSLATWKRQIEILNKQINNDLINFTQKIDLNDPLFEVSDMDRRESIKRFINNFNVAVTMVKGKHLETVEHETTNIEMSSQPNLENSCMDMKHILQYIKSINLGDEIQAEATAILASESNTDFTPSSKQYADLFSSAVKLI